jgi:hypothetical protein
MKILSAALLALLPFTVGAQSAKTDTVDGVVIYTARTDLAHITGGDFHTYTIRATEIKTDTGIISIRTQFGYIDLRKQYQFIPMSNLQPARLKNKP